MRQMAHLMDRLNTALEQRQIAEGIRLLEKAAPRWRSEHPSEPGDPLLALCVAQWIDVGYRDQSIFEAMLDRFPPNHRALMPLREYLQLRLAEAFRAMLLEDADSAIELLDFVLKAERELNEERLIAVAHFWKGRSHRKKGEYEAALEHIVEARRRAEAMQAGKLAAVAAVQEAWLVFQKGDARQAMRLLAEAEQQLQSTDDLISRGNIESARGRIVRRAGEYAEALQHYDRAIAIYGQRDLDHRNLARTLVNAAYVKRLIALQLRKRIDAHSGRPQSRHRIGTERRSYRSRYAQVCREALEQLDRAGEIYQLHQHHGGTGSVLVNRGQLHLDMGAIDRAAVEGAKAYELGQTKHDSILMARARILEASAENARVDEQMGEDADTAVYANTAQGYADEAVTLAQTTQNRRLLAGAYIARGMTAANDYFEDWEEANQCASRAATLLRPNDRDHLGEELLALKSRILRASGIDETLRGWSEGIVGEKTFQQISEEFAELVIPKVWAREEKKIARVAEKLSISPKKVRRILRSVGLLE